MEKRTKEFLQVGFYLSKFGVITDSERYPAPPERLKVEKWNEAYRVFYEKLNGGRTILAFERSLKNARDSFDSHLTNSSRIGWRTENRRPSPLGKDAQIVFNEWDNNSEEEIWNIIKVYSDLNVKEYGQIFDDLIGVQESEEEYLKGRTEGGKIIVTSSKYERSPSIRYDAVKIHGLKCMVCGFDFEEFYGEWGKDFIEVHHLQSLASNEGLEVETSPETDLAVLCANCHRMVHRKKGITLTIEELKNKIKKTMANSAWLPTAR
jgi:5-methylcytosine-specific restriction endonuclease McrA